MKEYNNPICGHCGSKMNVTGLFVECPVCNSLFTETRNSCYSCPVCFSPLFLIYDRFQESVLLCSNPDCPAYSPMDSSCLGGGEPLFHFSIYDKSVVVILPESLSIVIMDGDNNGVVNSPPLEKLAKALRIRHQNT